MLHPDDDLSTSFVCRFESCIVYNLEGLCDEEVGAVPVGGIDRAVLGLLEYLLGDHVRFGSTPLAVDTVEQRVEFVNGDEKKRWAKL